MHKVTIAKVVAYLIAFIAAVSSYGNQVYSWSWQNGTDNTHQ